MMYSSRYAISHSGLPTSDRGGMRLWNAVGNRVCVQATVEVFPRVADEASQATSSIERARAAVGAKAFDDGLIPFQVPDQFSDSNTVGGHR